METEMSEVKNGGSGNLTVYFPRGKIYAVKESCGRGLNSLWFVGDDGEHHVLASLHAGESYLDEENLAALFDSAEPGRAEPGGVLKTIERLNFLNEPWRSSREAIDRSNGQPYSITLMHKEGEILHTAQKDFAADTHLMDALEDLGLIGMAEAGEIRMEFLNGAANVPIEDWRLCRPQSRAAVLMGEWDHFPKMEPPADEPDQGFEPRPAGAMEDCGGSNPQGELREGEVA